MAEEASVTLTVATGGGRTVTAVIPVRPSLVATTFVVPTLTAVITPSDDAVAIALLLVDQVTTRPVRSAPEPSFVVAVAVVVSPATREDFARETVTLATGAGPEGPPPPPPHAIAAKHKVIAVRLGSGMKGPLVACTAREDQYRRRPLFRKRNFANAP